ncbi:MAG: hypothetical protein JJ863_06365 [Deltaproteobacteria bacterium]|nr:hypothetical protein [Deltaproteobacteria bacterium]
MNVRIRGFALALLFGCGGCGGAEPEVRWPASAEVSLASELAATADAPLMPDGSRLDDAELPPDAPNIQARAHVFEGLWFAEVRLGDAADDTPLPLVVMLHGRGDRPRIPGGPFGRVPTAMRVLVPRGPLALGSGYAWARHSVTERDHHDDLAADLIAMADRLARLVRHVRRTRPTAGTPILTGFSQGAITAWTTALRHPNDVGLALPIAGWVPPGARPAPLSGTAPPIRAMHGTADPIVRIEPTRELVAALEAARVSVSLREYEGVEHVVTREMNALFEDWLEEALRERAPDLRGGLGEPGPDPEPVEPYELPLEEAVEEEAVPAPLPEDVPEEEESTEPLPEDGAEEGEATEPAETDDPEAESGEESSDQPEQEPAPDVEESSEPDEEATR